MNTSNTASQDRTLANASSWGEAWSPDEIDYVIAHTDTSTDEQIATHLGRTLYAVWNLQHRVRAGEFKAENVRSRSRLAHVREPRGYTFVGDDYPPGWFD